MSSNDDLRGIRVLYDIPAHMRDGVRLYGNLLRPDDDAPYPAVVSRTPYDKNNASPITGYARVLDLVRSGYVFFVQDIRGTHRSEGEYSVVGHEVEDGYDTIEWVAAQPWCDGNVGMLGESALGYMQLSAARLHPPHLRTICPFQTSFTRFPGIYAPGIPHSFMAEWVAQRDGEWKKPGMHSPEKAYARLRDYARRVQDTAMRYAPVAGLTQADMPDNNGLSFRLSMTKNLDDPTYFHRVNRADAYEDIEVPCLHLTGWHDFLCDETIDNYRQVQEKGGSLLAREQSRLIIGPWPHGSALPAVIDGVNYGPEASAADAGIPQNMVAWFDRWLKGKASPCLEGDKVRYFLMGANVWRTSLDWPPQMPVLPYYLHSCGRANGIDGDGVLSAVLPAHEQHDTFLYNPMDPTLVQTGDPCAAVIQDQQIQQRRQDVLIYNGAPFDKDMELVGEIHVRLFAASSARDTDFVCKLSDVYEDGRAYSIAARLIRARFRNGYPARLITPGEIIQYDFRVGNTAIVLPKGHRLRLEIASSLFPDAEPNLNTGEKLGYDVGYERAVQKVYHDVQYPSMLLLPLREADV